MTEKENKKPIEDLEMKYKNFPVEGARSISSLRRKLTDPSGFPYDIRIFEPDNFRGKSIDQILKYHPGKSIKLIQRGSIDGTLYLIPWII